MTPIHKRHPTAVETPSVTEDIVSEDDPTLEHPVELTDSPGVVFGQLSLESTIPSESLSRCESEHPEESAFSP
jgi:hypothetical protein